MGRLGEAGIAHYYPGAGVVRQAVSSMSGWGGGSADLFLRPHGPVAWVDTAFNGGLTIPRALVAGLGLPQESPVGRSWRTAGRPPFETFGCHFDWSGGTCQTQVVASDGAHPLLGTQLPSGRRLAIDYAARTVELT